MCFGVWWFGAWFFMRLFDVVMCICPASGLVVPGGFALLCGTVGWALARRIGGAHRRPAVLTFFIIMWTVAVGACAYTAWGRFLVTRRIFDIDPSQAWPHPDRAILTVYDWWEARNPVGNSTYHGQWPRVRFTFDLFVFCLAGAAGACSGLLGAPLCAPLLLRHPILRVHDNLRFFTRPLVRRLFALVGVLAAAWFLAKMEQTRRQWEDQATWAQRGASADYRGGKLVGLRFNCLTLAMQYYGTDKLGDADVIGWIQSGEWDDLEDLGLTDAQLTDAGLAHVVTLHGLKSLNLTGTRITDAGLKHLTKCPHLAHLDLSRTRVTGTGLSNLAGLADMDLLALDDTPLTDEGIACLPALPQLRFLSLKNTPITDRGIARLPRLPGLDALYLDDTKVTDRGLARIREVWPFLGISGPDDE